MNPDTQRLLAHLHRGGNFAYYWLVSVAKNRHGQALEKRTVWYENDAPPPSIPAERNGHGPRHIYFGVHPVNTIPTERTSNDGKTYRPKPEKVRVEVNEISAVNALYGDVDAKDFGGDKGAARDRIDEFGEYGIPTPSVLVDSGGGYYPFWLLREPFILDTPEKRDRARRLQDRWIKLIDADGSVSDLARVLRLPGTTNFKYETAPVCQFVYADFERLYTFEELEALLPPETPQDAPQPRQRAAAPSSDHLRRWVDERIDIACNHIVSAPKGTGSDERYDMGRLAGGVVHAGVYTEQEIIDMLLPYALKRSTDSPKETERNLWNGLKRGQLDPLPIPTFPTTHQLVMRGPWAHCPACDGFVARSKYPYPGTSEPGWYCPSCRGEMKWPLDAWTPPERATGAEVTPLGAPRPVGAPGASQERRRGWLNADEIDRIKDPTFLINDFLVAGEVTVIAGPGSSGKTYAVIDAALRTAQHYGVMYVAGEDAPGVKLRRNAWTQFWQQPRPEQFLMWTEYFSLFEEGSVQDFISQVLPLGIKLIVLDTLSQCSRGADENSSKDMGIVMSNAQRIAHETGAAVLIIHHSRKDGNGYRGSSKIVFDTYGFFEVSKIDDVVEIAPVRVKNAEGIKPRYFRFIAVQVGSKESAVIAPAARVLSGKKLTENQAKILTTLALMTDSVGGAKSSELGQATNLSGNAYFKPLKALREKDYIQNATPKHGAPLIITQMGREALAEHTDDPALKIATDADVPTVLFEINTTLDTIEILSDSNDSIATTTSSPLSPLLRGREESSSAVSKEGENNGGMPALPADGAIPMYGFYTLDFAPDVATGAPSEELFPEDGAPQMLPQGGEKLPEVLSESSDSTFPAPQTLDDLFAVLPFQKRMSIRALLRSRQEHLQERAREACERYGVDYETARALAGGAPSARGETA